MQVAQAERVQLSALHDGQGEDAAALADLLRALQRRVGDAPRAEEVVTLGAVLGGASQMEGRKGEGYVNGSRARTHKGT